MYFAGAVQHFRQVASSSNCVIFSQRLLFIILALTSSLYLRGLQGASLQSQLKYCNKLRRLAFVAWLINDTYRHRLIVPVLRSVPRRCRAQGNVAIASVRGLGVVVAVCHPTATLTDILFR